MKMNETVLWVEDVPDEIGIAYRLLRNRGFSITHSPTRRLAYKRLDGGEQYDLVIVDERMQGEASGYSIFRDLRDGRWGAWGRKAPVIFVTGYGQIARDRIRGIIPQPLAVIGKPITRELVESQLLTILESVRARRPVSAEASEVQESLDPTLEVVFADHCEVDETRELSVSVRPLGEMQEPFGEVKKELPITVESRAGKFEVEPRNIDLKVFADRSSDVARFQLTAVEPGDATVEVQLFSGPDRVGYAVLNTKIAPLNSDESDDR